MIDYIPRRFTVIRDKDLCVNCGKCITECSNGCHLYSPKDKKTVISKSDNCVACHRCVSMCPVGALRIEKYVCDYRDNANWTPQYQQEICRQANTGSTLLSAMGNPKPFPIYWDKILLNASQVTNPSIDPLREPMEIRTILGRKPQKMLVEKKGKSLTEMPPQVVLETPIMFSAMSFGSISLNAQKSLAMAARELGTLFNTGEGGLHNDLTDYGRDAVVQVASGRFGVYKDYLENSRFIEIKIGQGAKPGIGGHLPGEKVNVEVSNARMIPVGSDAISPAPHHDIYSIEDLRQLIWSLKQATNGEKPVAVKIAAVHNIAAIASGAARAGADIVVIDGFRGAPVPLPQESGTMSAFRLSLRLPPRIKGCATRAFAQPFHLLWPALSAALRILLRQSRSAQTLAISPLRRLLQWAATCAKPATPANAIGALPLKNPSSPKGSIRKLCIKGLSILLMPGITKLKRLWAVWA